MSRYGAIIHSGSLLKRSKGKSWTARYAVLWEDMAVRFYESKSRNNVIGKIKMCHITDTKKLSPLECNKLDSKHPYLFSMMSISLKKTWQFGCEDVETLNKWLNVLQSIDHYNGLYEGIFMTACTNFLSVHENIQLFFHGYMRMIDMNIYQKAPLEIIDMLPVICYDIAKFDHDIQYKWDVDKDKIEFDITENMIKLKESVKQSTVYLKPLKRNKAERMRKIWKIKCLRNSLDFEEYIDGGISENGLQIKFIKDTMNPNKKYVTLVYAYGLSEFSMDSIKHGDIISILYVNIPQQTKKMENNIMIQYAINGIVHSKQYMTDTDKYKLALTISSSTSLQLIQ